VGIHRQVVRIERAGVFQKTAGQPVIFGGGGEVLNLFTEVATKNLPTARPRRPYESNSKRCSYAIVTSAAFPYLDKPSMPTCRASTDLSVSR